ncbi:hypothetical protein KARMA_0566 [Donghicola eburneus]|uniref:Uncharacterized protein n=1 Tax=Donghicola eburneus TaxID=393278 RepID=A0A1M4MVJ2_9RHOB|nr:hypothetical protein KARMA_0566 [Donghicola eburneus]
MADQLFCEKRLDWDAPVTEVLTLAQSAASSEEAYKRLR